MKKIQVIIQVEMEIESTDNQLSTISEWLACMSDQVYDGLQGYEGTDGWWRMGCTFPSWRR